jgi:Ulp1 family protease
MSISISVNFSTSFSVRVWFNLIVSVYTRLSVVVMVKGHECVQRMTRDINVFGTLHYVLIGLRMKVHFCVFVSNWF